MFSAFSALNIFLPIFISFYPVSGLTDMTRLWNDTRFNIMFIFFLYFHRTKTNLLILKTCTPIGSHQDIQPPWCLIEVSSACLLCLHETPALCSAHTGPAVLCECVQYGAFFVTINHDTLQSCGLNVSCQKIKTATLHDMLENSF